MTRQYSSDIIIEQVGDATLEECRRVAFARALAGLHSWAERERLPTSARRPVVERDRRPAVLVEHIDDDAITDVYTLFDHVAAAQPVAKPVQPLVPDTDRRAAKRLSLDVPVRYAVKGGEQTLRATIGDISRHGIFIRTDTPPAVGTTVACGFFVDGDPHQVVAIRGKVVWSGDSETPGFGVRVVTAAPEHLERLQAFIARIDARRCEAATDRAFIDSRIALLAPDRPDTIPGLRFAPLI